MEVKQRQTVRFAVGWAWRVKAAMLAAVWVVMWVFNCLTPLISDDYTYLMRYPTTEPIRSLWDVVVSEYENYLLWSGRSVALGLTQLFLWLGKWLFNLCNAGVFCLLLWLCAKLAVGRRPVPPLLLAVCTGLLIHLNPCFGAVNLWVTGSCVYLWPLTITLAFLLPYRLALEDGFDGGRGAAVGLFAAGVAAGWGNENTSGAAVLACLLMILLLRLFRRRTPLWAGCGLLGSVTGFLLLLCACRPSWKTLALPALWFVLALAANYALVLSPVYYVRSFYPVLAFLVTGIAACLQALTEYMPDLRGAAPQAAAAGALCVLLFFDVLLGGYDIASYYMMRRVREAEITAAAAAGQTDIVTYAVFPYTRFCGAWGQPDLRQDEKNWVNTNMAMALDVGTLRAAEQHYYPFPGYDDFSYTVESEMALGLE